MCVCVGSVRVHMCALVLRARVFVLRFLLRLGLCIVVPMCVFVCVMVLCMRVPVFGEHPCALYLRMCA